MYEAIKKSSFVCFYFFNLSSLYCADFGEYVLKPKIAGAWIVPIYG